LFWQRSSALQNGHFSRVNPASTGQRECAHGKGFPVV
jgi:hypothetical protein